MVALRRDGAGQEDIVSKAYRIGFALVDEHSSYNAAFGLASIVEARGHEAVFFVDDETVFSRAVTFQGFRTAVMPSGHEPHIQKPVKAGKFRLWKRLKNRAINNRLEQDFLAALLKSNSLDLCFLDAIRYDLYPFALALAKAKVPTLLLSPTYASEFGATHPPVFSSVASPGATRSGIPYGTMRAMRWLWALATRGHGQAFDRVEYLRIVVRKWLDQMRNVSFEWQLRRFGCRSAWSEYRRRPLLPQIVFGHRALDWPDLASDPHRCYFGTTDQFRKNSDFNWPAVDPGKPVVYCNLSTINGFDRPAASGSEGQVARASFSRVRFRMAERYVKAVLDCFSQQAGWQLFIACGPFYTALKGEVSAPNIHLFERLPQLAVLKQADLAITWGGAGTIRECISLGVPMIILPAWTDQFGNAARVVSCNIGLRGDLMRVTPDELKHMVERVLTDRQFGASLDGLREQSNAGQEIDGIVRFVQQHTGLSL